MEESNKEFTFTDENIMKAIMKTSPENRGYILAIPYSDLFFIANGSEYAQCFINICDEYIEGCKKMKEAVYEFLEKIQEQATESVINEMADVYKELSREERLEFCKKIAQESTLENSLDLIDYNWKHLIGTLQKVVKQ